MAKLKLQGKDLRKIGYPEGPVIGLTIQVFNKHFKHYSQGEANDLLKKILAQPEGYTDDEVLKPIAFALKPPPLPESEREISLNQEGAHFNIFGRDYIEEGALNQMYTAAKLPVSIAGALMPDAHSGYGLPIGGVLATENAVIPYGVGVDIGCRMCLSVYPLPENELSARHNMFKNILLENTRFGAGGEIKNPGHDVLEREEFRLMPLLRELQEKAARQLGTSGSGNHFVEFGIVEITEYDSSIKVPPGKYLALLSHSGSRGLGANIAHAYTKLAMQKRRLPQEAKHLAWLYLNEQEGHEYWLAMNIAGDYASACHHVIHDKISKAIGEKPIARVENHHNFAWKEIHNGKEVIVHRKGATPAGKNVLGIIPGSMTLPGYIVKGKGEEASISSASHGAGRLFSRTQAKKSISWNSVQEMLNKYDVTLIGGGLDEAPQAYKNIDDVMKAQKNLVDVIGTFHPRIVRMVG
jgi:tRNA-splicing ligase RtcB (3'-phosphate/5'-hydroxy nucleic acid ligase)